MTDGGTDLAALLAELSPRRHPGTYVFAVVDGPVPAGLAPVVTVAEAEGTTVVVPREEADRAGLPYRYVAAWLTLEVHSALEAVGLTAAVAGALAGAGISANVVAGAAHDHLFVPADRADEALAVLRSLAAG